LYPINPGFIRPKPTLLALRQSVKPSRRMTFLRIVTKDKSSLLPEIFLRKPYTHGFIREGTNDETRNVTKSALIHINVRILGEKLPITTPEKHIAALPQL
jgi:hypothetical protein